MRIAFAFLLAACAGCSTGNAPGSDNAETGGTGNASSGGSSAAGRGGSAGQSSGGNAGTSSSGSAGTGVTAGTGNTAGSMGGPMPGVGIGAITQCTDPSIVGPTPIRRLSRLEYYNAVRDVFGVEVNQGDLPSDELLGGVFTANVRLPMTSDVFTRYDTAAKSVGDQVAASIATSSGCAMTDAACLQTYLLGKARRAFHGVFDANDPERQRFADLYGAVAPDGAPLAVSTAVRWILLSPRFLYTVEFGTTEGNFARLGPSELAGRLASFVWRSVPDDALLAAADSGGLDTDEGLRQQASRLLADAKAQPVLKSFVNEWLGIKASPPGAPALDTAIDAEAGDVFVAATQGSGTYSDLLTATTTRGNQELAQFYGGTLGGDGSISVPAERAGLLLRAGFLRSHIKGDLGSPTLRGKQIRMALLCDPVASPATNVNMGLPDDREGKTGNDLFLEHANNPACSGCHSKMDPIGFAFGQYGPDGKFDPSLAASTAGAIVPGDSNPMDFEFQNVSELVNLLATDVNPEQCFVIQTNRFALGRNETAADACGLAGIWDAYEAGNANLQTLFLEVAVSNLMRVRNIVRPGETCQ